VLDSLADQSARLWDLVLVLVGAGLGAGVSWHFAHTASKDTRQLRTLITTLAHYLHDERVIRALFDKEDNLIRIERYEGYGQATLAPLTAYGSGTFTPPDAEAQPPPPRTPQEPGEPTEG
jgi:hypothetical protein